jgi:hypothetical protein
VQTIYQGRAPGETKEQGEVKERGESKRGREVQPDPDVEQGPKGKLCFRVCPTLNKGAGFHTPAPVSAIDAVRKGT